MEKLATPLPICYLPGQHCTSRPQAAADKHPYHKQTIYPVACLRLKPLNYLLIGNNGTLHPEIKKDDPENQTGKGIPACKNSSGTGNRTPFLFPFNRKLHYIIR
ncbi:hypothetical protein EQO05_08190 [Methanosarcina sp. MSH10X1]|uniref:hypothetical protein n=1 Tax=Methanosarcina sp. MSH10X1 TaxID=2507075 RepID=UPI000FFBC61E|nr:hypothetical protein [Methanosarcina sp. MSH10X1]RXA19574.1 hypothetical protein EQO05_08190 [Methanosarcina sp. MSH10X1]